MRGMKLNFMGGQVMPLAKVTPLALAVAATVVAVTLAASSDLDLTSYCHVGWKCST